MNKDILRNKQRLDHIFVQIGSLDHDPELMSHWARYLCVLVSGFIETSVRLLYSEYAMKKSAPFVANYVQSKLNGFQNAKMAKILELTKMFSPHWESELRKVTEGEIKDAVDSVVANRHRIAHGGSVSLTFMQIQAYYPNVIKVIELISDNVNS